jgi:hypothetical protein
MKGGLEALLGVPKKDTGSEAGDGLADAMSDLGEALADKDWSAAATAFRRAKSLCESEYEAEDEEDDDEE